MIDMSDYFYHIFVGVKTLKLTKNESRQQIRDFFGFSKKIGSVGGWETKHYMGMALYQNA